MIEAEVIKAISTVGFPIVAFLLMFWQSTTAIKSNTAALKELSVMIKMRRR